MRKREQPEGKKIDALGILAICIVIAVIVGCVIAQIRVFKTTGWQLIPSAPLQVHARSTRASEQRESSSLLPGNDSQVNDSKFNSDRFGYGHLNDGITVSLRSGKNMVAPGLNSLLKCFSASFDFCAVTTNNR